MSLPSSPAPAAAFRVQVVVAFLAVYVIWGSTYLGIKVAIEAMPPFLMAGARFALAGALMLAWLAAVGRFRPSSLDRPMVFRAAAVGVLMLGLGNGCVVWAISHGAPSGLAAVMVATTPFWLVGLDRLADRSQRIHPLVVVGLVVGFVGIAVLAGLGGSAPAGLDTRAVVALLVATFSWACGSVLSKRGARPAAPLVSTGLQMVLGGAALLAYSAATERWSDVDLAAITARSWIGFAYLVVFGSLVGYTAFIWLLRHVSAAAVGTYAYVNPVVAVLLGAMLAGEPVTTRTMVASGMILAAVVVITTARRLPLPARRRPPAPPAATGVGAAAYRQ